MPDIAFARVTARFDSLVAARIPINALHRDDAGGAIYSILGMCCAAKSNRMGVHSAAPVMHWRLKLSGGGVQAAVERKNSNRNAFRFPLACGGRSD